jgi:hypothetical protein
MAQMALHPLMRAGERILRLPLVIELPEFPSHGLMTQGAIVPEPFLVEAILVTGGAFAGSVLEGRRTVTCLAKHKAMQTDQREAGLVMIEIDLLPPPAFIMASLAFGAELPLMRIVFFVAGGAGRWQLFAIKVALVAGIAFRLPVLAAQSKFRLPVVVELDGVPFFRAMTIVAFGPVAAAMHVLQLMAKRACRADALVAFAGMAGMTFWNDRIV